MSYFNADQSGRPTGMEREECRECVRLRAVNAELKNLLREAYQFVKDGRYGSGNLEGKLFDALFSCGAEPEIEIDLDELDRVSRAAERRAL